MSVQEVEPNNTFQTANLVSIGQAIQGEINANGDLDYYKFQADKGGRLILDFTHPVGIGTSGGGILVQLVDSDGTAIVSQTFYGNGQLVGTVPASGDYYVIVSDNNGSTVTYQSGTYALSTALTSESTSAYDGADNNSISTAISKLADGVATLSPGATLTGSIGANGDTDYFKVHADKGGQLRLDFAHPLGVVTSGGGILVQLVDSDGTAIVSQTFYGNGQLEGTVPASGDYYVVVSDNNGSTVTYQPGIYAVSTSLTSESTSAYDGADNNSISTAISTLADGVTTLLPGATLTGSMGANADVDYFKVQSSAAGRLTLDFTHPDGIGTSGGNIQLLLRDSDGTVITYKNFTGSGKLEATVPSLGDYFVTVMEADSSTGTFTKGIYSVATSFTSDPNSAYDGADNNGIANAVSNLADGITLLTFNNNHAINGSLGANADVDYFKVQTSSGGSLNLDFTHPNGVGTSGGKITVQLRDGSDAILTTKDFTGSGKLSTTLPSSGDYFVKVIEADSSSGTFTEGIYSIKWSSISPTDTTAPTVTVFNPADEAIGVAVNSNIVVTFNEAIQRGTGSILIKTASGSTVASYDAATSNNLSISGSTLTINPSSDLSNNTGYTVEFAAGSIKDIAGNSYAGTSAYNFTTGTDTSPATAYSVPGTLGNDFFLPSGGNNYLGGGGSDTYIISPHTLSGAVTAKIIDTEGTNVIQLVDGLTITSSSFYSSAVQLTLSNGAIVQILGATAFGYQVGANAPAGDTASSQTYAQFAATLGASVPTGSTPVSGTTNFVVPTGASSAITLVGVGVDVNGLDTVLASGMLNL